MSNKIKTSKEYLQDLEKKFVKDEMTENSALLAKHVSVQYNYKDVAVRTLQKKQHKEQDQDYCFLCGTKVFREKQYSNYHARCARKGTLLNFVYSEVNSTSMP